MGTVNVTLGDGKKLNLILGQQLENAVTAVVFDFSAWQTEFGSGTLGLSVQRHGDTQPYAVVPTVSGTNATWNISELDTAYKGMGEVQVTYTVGTKVKKSVVYKFTVYRSLGENGEYPSPGQTWQEEIEDELADVRQDLSYMHDGYELIHYDIIKNSYPAADGSFPSYNNWDRTDYIPVEEGEMIFIVNPTSSTSDNAWYDSSKNIISRFQVPVGQPFIIYVPTGASYMVVSQDTAKFFTAIYRYADIANNVTSKSLGDGILKALSESLDIDVLQTSWVQGYVADGGSINTGSTGFRRTGQIPISDKRMLWIDCPVAYSSLFVSLYSNGSYVKNVTISTQPYLIPYNIDSLIVNLYFGSVIAFDIVNQTNIFLQKEDLTADHKKEDVRLSTYAKHGLVDLLDYATLEVGKYDQSTGEKANSTTLCRSSEMILLPVGTKINLLPLITGARSFHIFTYDINGNFVQFVDIPSISMDGDYFYTTDTPYINFEFYIESSDNLSIAKHYFRVVAHLCSTTYKGKKLSVLGDSLSSYDGVSDHDTAYYPTGNIGGKGLMYWQLLASDLEMTIDTINAYGGSTVASVGANGMSTDVRLANLGYPDLVIFAGGTNDIYSNIASGEWEGNTIADLDATKFIPAYTKCLQYIQANHPSAEIIALSPAFIGGRTESFRTNCTIENIQRIVECEKLVCEYMGVKFIDSRKLGMTMSNTANYTVENLHWNAQFEQLANKALKDALLS